jgi:hypothetical protein
MAQFTALDFACCVVSLYEQELGANVAVFVTDFPKTAADTGCIYLIRRVRRRSGPAGNLPVQFGQPARAVTEAICRHSNPIQ